MKKIFCGISGTNDIPKTHNLSKLPLAKEIIHALMKYYQEDLLLRPAQEYAVFDKGILNDRQNLIITTPTNSGKSLLSYLLLLQDAMEGKTVILIEPLRALAYEKAVELKKIADIMREQSKIKMKITISTGDYRLTEEFINTQPKEFVAGRGQIIVATPERLDAISRFSENVKWFEGVSLVCIDEAHMIGDINRGPTLELLITYLRSLRNVPRIVLMSATIANPDHLASWLSPAKVIDMKDRYPQLEKWVYCMEDTEDINAFILEEVETVIKKEDKSVIIFVYQTLSAEKLALQIAKKISGRTIAAHDLHAVMNVGVAWFHANMSAAMKSNIVAAVKNGSVKVIVSTTALSMGINLPATHVYVRDLTFTGFKDLDICDLLQMLGRAGRGNKSGTGVVMLNKSNLSKAPFVVQGLKKEALPIIKSALLLPIPEEHYESLKPDMFYIDRVGSQLVGALNRFESVTKEKLVNYLQRTLCGERFANTDDILGYLMDWKLAYMDENTNEYALTALGKVSSRCCLPPITAANMGQFIRDLLQDDPCGKHLANFAPIDYLILLCLTSNEFKAITRYSRKVEESVAQYMEALPLEEKSYIYRTWLASKPECLWGSARIADYTVTEARKQVYVRTYIAMLIHDLSKGGAFTQMKDFYKTDVEEIQEKIRDNAIWLLAGMERLMNVRSFFYHLKENCGCSSKQIHDVDAAFKKASKTVFSLTGSLKYRSKLGEMVRSIKRIYPHADSYPGEGTIKRLESAGIYSVKDLVKKNANDLVAIGVSKKYADLIVGYVRRRLL